MLRDVRERLRRDEVRGPLRGRAAVARRARALLTIDGRDRAAADDRFERRDEPSVEQDRGGDPADEVADLGEGLARLRLALEDQRLRGRRVGVEALAREAQVDVQHDEPLLGAVVEVALDPVELARLGVEDRRAALAQDLDLAAQLAALGGAEQGRRRRRDGAR